VHALLHRFPELAQVGGEGRPGIVHRLDRETSGLLVVARTPRAYLGLVEALRARTIHRGYDALVWGQPPRERGTLETLLGRDPRRRQRMSVLPRGGRPARTHWRVIERFGLASRLAVRLDTGRTHQIRVHMAHLGHPVVADAVYGGRGKKLLSMPEPGRSLAIDLLKCLPRQALHASELRLSHPVTGRPLAFASPWPQDFMDALELLRKRGARGRQ
jgi:23S rRNA pseudouridine1911/1915/1917 synthase